MTRKNKILSLVLLTGVLSGVVSGGIHKANSLGVLRRVVNGISRGFDSFWGINPPRNTTVTIINPQGSYPGVRTNSQWQGYTGNSGYVTSRMYIPNGGGVNSSSGHHSVRFVAPTYSTR